MIYFSSLIKNYKTSTNNLFNALDKENIEYALIEGTKDIWLRDFMPVKTKSGRYISFRYVPDYLKDFRHLQTDFSADINGILKLPIIKSGINLDGGNVVLSPSKEKAIISDRIFTENDIPKSELLNKLEKLLEAEITIIPSMKSDMTGHVDGMVRFLDENTVVANNLLSKSGYEFKVQKALKKSGFKVIDFPYYWQEGNPLSAKGCYINFLETEKVIFLPIFNNEMDEKALLVANRIFKKKIVPVEINEIALQGGLLNCISWEND